MFRIKALHSVEPLRSKGFTLIELMVVVAMLGVLAALAAPSFADMLRRMRVESMREELQASIANARVEAISRGRPVVLLRTAPCPQAANALDWDCGWTAFIDLDGDDAIDVGEPTLHVVQGKPGTRIRRNPGASIATIDRFGQPPISSIQIFPAGDAFGPADGVLLCVARSGRVRVC
ncbi:GspH/FimT family pseudopilin [Hydrogenophaga sp.]|uniref:GspH/FimT family pseudopilin n=1 Tax=Hydrogenophaga sp. TaxID=1904254 RepID=UPI00272FC9FE|nr:GspH/FimT family pseudopilin [Hydrogenophaga sp.]MDP2016247.1 GspH/FimT family pseudopilin [Hydrogenophaga sp.]MDP3164244.1 GspH/FimT family pseudopilin [Hydrogenophaga sp.]MDP3811105.1 GspH/FimT family pseudopilin [Hydrogenophaga sp.]